MIAQDGGARREKAGAAKALKESTRNEHVYVGGEATGERAGGKEDEGIEVDFFAPEVITQVPCQGECGGDTNGIDRNSPGCPEDIRMKILDKVRKRHRNYGDVNSGHQESRSRRNEDKVFTHCNRTDPKEEMVRNG